MLGTVQRRQNRERQETKENGMGLSTYSIGI